MTALPRLAPCPPFPPQSRLAYPRPPCTRHSDFPALVRSCQHRLDLPRLATPLLVPLTSHRSIPHPTRLPIPFMAPPSRLPISAPSTPVRIDLPRLPSACQACSNRLPAPLQHHFKPGPTDYPTLPASRHPCPSPCDYPSHLATMLPLPTALPDPPRSHPTSTTHPVTSHVASFTYRLPVSLHSGSRLSTSGPTTRPVVPSVRSISTVHKGVRS